MMILKISIKNCLTCLEFQVTQPKDKTDTPHDISGKMLETAGVDVFMLNGTQCRCLIKIKNDNIFRIWTYEKDNVSMLV